MRLTLKAALRLHIVNSSYNSITCISKRHLMLSNVPTLPLATTEINSHSGNLSIKVITKLPNSEQSYKGKVKPHNYINRQNQSTTLFFKAGDIKEYQHPRRQTRIYNRTTNRKDCTQESSRRHIFESFLTRNKTSGFFFIISFALWMTSFVYSWSVYFSTRSFYLYLIIVGREYWSKER
jgi:hypothetical protein